MLDSLRGRDREALERASLYSSNSGRGVNRNSACLLTRSSATATLKQQFRQSARGGLVERGRRTGEQFLNRLKMAGSSILHSSEGTFMPCALCQSGNQSEFSAEIMIHFSGLKHIDKPAVFCVSEGFDLLGLRLFAIYDSGNRVAPAKSKERCRLPLPESFYWLPLCIRDHCPQQSSADKLLALTHRFNRWQ